MNNSDLRDLIRRKGFAAGNSAGIVLVLPDSQRVHRLDSARLAWLESLNDVVQLKDKNGQPYKIPGYQVGDRVQIFSWYNNYRFWGKFGTIINTSDKTEMGKMARVGVDDETSFVFLVTSLVVIERTSIGDLSNKTTKELQDIFKNISQD